MGRGKRVGLYTRISQARHGGDGRIDDLGVRRQETECRQLCDRRGWQVVAVFTDNDVSAYSGKPRPGYIALLEAVKAGDLDVIVAWHPDRLHRSPKELESFIDLIDASGVQVATVVAGDYDLTTSSGRMTARVLGATARHESEHKSERIRSKMKELAMTGNTHGGTSRSYGYDGGRIVAAEAKVVRDVVRRLLAGESMHAVTANLNRRGIPTVSGKPWKPQNLRSVILRPRLAGQRVHRGEIVGNGDWKAIIPPEQHRQLVALLTDDARRKNRTARTYLLTGVVRCGRCGHTMMSNRRSESGQRTYACMKSVGGCGRMRVVADATEEEVVAQLLYATETGNLAARLQAPAPSESADDLAAVATRMNELAEDWATGTITRSEWHTARAVLERQLDELRQAEAAEVRASAEYVNLDNLERRWPRMTFDQQRAVVAKIIDTVTIDPPAVRSNRFDPDRITINWRA